MARNFSRKVHFDKKEVLAIVVPQMRKNGMHYEINIKGFPRFYMGYSALGRYDAVGEEAKSIPYNLILAVSDMLENE